MKDDRQHNKQSVSLHNIDRIADLLMSIQF